MGFYVSRDKWLKEALKRFIRRRRKTVDGQGAASDKKRLITDPGTSPKVDLIAGIRCFNEHIMLYSGNNRGENGNESSAKKKCDSHNNGKFSVLWLCGG